MTSSRKSGGRWRGIQRPRQCRTPAMERVFALIRHGCSLRAIAARDGMPTLDTLCRWLEEDRGFRARYERVRRSQQEVFADDALELALAVTGPDRPGAELRMAALKWRFGPPPKLDPEQMRRPGFDLDDDAVARLQRAADRFAREATAQEGAPNDKSLDDAPSDDMLSDDALPEDMPSEAAPLEDTLENRFAPSPSDHTAGYDPAGDDTGRYDTAGDDPDLWGDDR